MVCRFKESGIYHVGTILTIFANERIYREHQSSQNPAADPIIPMLSSAVVM